MDGGGVAVPQNFVVVSNGNEIDAVVISGPNVTSVGSIVKRRFVGLF